MKSTYSIEEIYLQLGQYDYFSIFEFHPLSNAAAKYGTHVYGTIAYKPSERKVLEKAITLSTEERPSTNGIIILNGAMQNNEANQLLLKEGFRNTDIVRLTFMSHLSERSSYKDQSEKTIPDTISIDFEAATTIRDHLLFVWNSLSLQVRSDYPLTEDEYRHYYTLTFILYPDDLPDGIIDIVLKDPNTNEYYIEVEIEMLRYKYNTAIETGIMSITPEESARYKHLLKTLRLQRFKFIEEHLGISKQKLQEFKANDPEAYYIMYELAILFRTETLTPIGSNTLIYWDFKGYIHILLRHYKQFYISSSTKGQGSTFQYVLKDIRRLLKVVIKENLIHIETTLASGKDFRLYNEHAHYFNGNYYRIWISKEGRVRQFHPEDGLISA